MAIKAIYFDSLGPDDNSNTSLTAEWVQLKNTTGTTKTLTGWTLRDAAVHIYSFSSFSLATGAYVKIHTGSGSHRKQPLSRTSAATSGTTAATLHT